MNAHIKQWRLLAATSLLMVSTVAESSMIVAPHGAGRDADLAGVVVAAPDDGTSALLINPAGVVSKARDEIEFGIYPGKFKVSYKNPVTGYNDHGSKDFYALGFWYGMGEINGWSLGVGAYGSLGAAFNLPAAPGIGQTSPYLGEVGIINFAINAGRQLTPNLRFGVQVAPQFGIQKMRSPSPLGDISLRADGFGLGASAGLVYDVTDKMSFGLAYRTRGVARLSGDAHVGNVGQKDSIKFVSPQSITAGLAYQPADKLRLLGQLVWTRYTEFEQSLLEFHQSTMLTMPLVSKATNRLRLGAALEYEFIPKHTFRTGFTHSKAMIADSAVSPMMYDHDNDMIMAGYEMDFDTWRLGFSTGYLKNKDRTISVAANPNYPGTYKSSSPVSVGVRVIWQNRH
jgi:long-subunit fatty acid transport protein